VALHRRDAARDGRRQGGGHRLVACADLPQHDGGRDLPLVRLAAQKGANLVNDAVGHRCRW
jgi:hypothetical protein